MTVQKLSKTFTVKPRVAVSPSSPPKYATVGTLQSHIVSATSNSRWWVIGCYIWYSEEGNGRATAPPSPLLAVPNVTAHPSTVSWCGTIQLALHYKGLSRSYHQESMLPNRVLNVTTCYLDMLTVIREWRQPARACVDDVHLIRMTESNCKTSSLSLANRLSI